MFKNIHFLLIIPFLLLAGCSQLLPSKKTVPAPTSKISNTDDAQSAKEKPADYISMEIDGQPKQFTTGVVATEFQSMPSTVLMATGNDSDYFQITIPSRVTGTYNQSEQNTGLHYGINLNSNGQFTSVSYEPNTSSGTDQFTIQVTSYDNQKVTGTFSGTLTELKLEGFQTKQIKITNGQFSVSKFEKL